MGIQPHAWDYVRAYTEKQREETLTGQKNTPTSLALGQGYIHGSGGVLSDPGQHPAIFSAMARPFLGIAQVMPIINDPLVSEDYSGVDTPYFTIFTGQLPGDDDFDDQPATECDDPPVAGKFKFCSHTAPFGLLSKRVDLTNRRRVGRLSTYGETQNFQMKNPILAEDVLNPGNISDGTGGWINQEISARMIQAAIGFQRMTCPLVYTGNPTNNNAGGGARQFMGFDLIYNTGKVDFKTQVACPNTDALVVDLGEQNVNEADANGVYVYQHLEHVMRFLRSRARKSGLDPVQWVLSMREDLFYELADIFPVQRHVRLIAMMTTINGANNGGILNLAGSEVEQLRQQIREGRFLPIDGGLVPVVLDDCIAETTGQDTSEYVSDIYVHPMTILGGMPNVYWQFSNYDNNQGRAWDQLVSRGQTWTTDAGRFLWSFNQKNGCADMAFWTEPRIICHAPFLAARIQDIAYEPGIHTISPFPGDANYYNGGRTTGTPETGYPAWSTGTQVNLGVFE